MKVVLYMATGMAQKRILQELISRGHQVTAAARDISKVPSTVTGSTYPEISFYPPIAAKIVSLGIDQESRSIGSVTPTFTFRETLAFLPVHFFRADILTLNYTPM